MTTDFADGPTEPATQSWPIEPLAAPDIDPIALRASRLARLRATMTETGLDMCVLTNPVSIRYATGYRDYATFQSRIPSAYAIVPVVGPIVVHGAYTSGLETVANTRVSHAPTVFDAGLDLGRASQRFVEDIALAVCEAGLDVNATIGAERLLPTTHHAVNRTAYRVVDAEPTIELARSRKAAIEIEAIRFAITVAEHGMTRMADRLRPGVRENQLWALLHEVNVVNDGEWFDGRMLCSGPRTNPWYQEASPRRVERGDLVAFDTDMIGPFGYCADISRTWVCDAEPTPSQLDLHGRALAEIEHNTDLLRVGASFAEIAHRVFAHPSDIAVNRYACAIHGVGMTDEYPKIPYPQDWDDTGYDGQIEDGMVLSVESYVGRYGGTDGVKVEQMVHVTHNGVLPLSAYSLGLH